MAQPLSLLGLIHLELGHPARAVPLLERAQGLKHDDAQVQGLARFTLARALRALGREQQRSRALAAEAQEVFRAAELERDRAAVEAWLAGPGR